MLGWTPGKIWVLERVQGSNVARDVADEGIFGTLEVAFDNFGHKFLRSRVGNLF